MSAFIVSKQHVDGIVSAALSHGSRYGSRFGWFHEGEWHKLEDPDSAGAMLWAENEASVSHRYSRAGREAIYGEGWDSPDESLPGTYQLEIIAPGVAPVETPEWLSEYRFRRMDISPVQALKAIQCLDYQSCEHDEWEGSEAFAFCKYLTQALIQCLPGYDEAPWGIS